MASCHASRPAPLLVGAVGVALTALGFLNPVWETVVQQRVPSGVLARVTAYDWLVSLAAMPLGYALGPLLAEAATPALPLIGSAVLVAVTAVGTAAVRDVRQLGTAPPPDTQAHGDAQAHRDARPAVTVSEPTRV